MTDDELEALYDEAEDEFDEQCKRDAESADYPEGRLLDCGHMAFYKSEVMMTSRGTCCSGCYDRRA